MKKYLIGTALAIMVLLSAMQVASATYELYIVWDEQERAVYAGNGAEFNLTLFVSSTGEPVVTSTPSPTVPPTTWPTPPPPPEDSCSVNGPSCSMGGQSGSSLMSLNMLDVNNVYLSVLSPPGWDVVLSAESLIYEGEDSKEVTVDVTSPADANPGLYSILFTAELEGVEQNISLPVRVLDPFDVFISNVNFSPAEPRLGDEITFTADLTLDGNVLIPSKIVALYINQISQTKLASTEVDLEPNSTETVVLRWTANQIGDFTAKMYVNPTNNETSVENNELTTELTILPAEDPCNLADDTYLLALDMYDEDCESAISTLQVAKALYEQCGDTDGAALCDSLIEKCDQYTLAEELEGQGDILAANGDCDGAIEKWNAAIDIYEVYGDQARIDALNSKIENCVLPVPEPDESFLEKYWMWLLLLLVFIALFLILLIYRRKKEEEEDTTFGLYPSGEGETPKSGLEQELSETAKAEIPPLIPIPVASKDEKDEITKFLANLEKALGIYTPDKMRSDMKASVAMYSSIVDKRNSLMQKMDEATRIHVDKLIKEFEDRLFNTL